MLLELTSIPSVSALLSVINARLGTLLMDLASLAMEAMKIRMAIVSSQQFNSHLIWAAAYGTLKATFALNAQKDSSLMARNVALFQINAEHGMLQEPAQVAMMDTIC